MKRRTLWRRRSEGCERKSRMNERQYMSLSVLVVLSIFLRLSFFLSLHVFTFSSCFFDSSHVMFNDERTFILTTHGLSLSYSLTSNFLFGS